MGNLLSLSRRKKTETTTTSFSDNYDSYEKEKLYVLIDLLRLENDKLKTELDNKITSNNHLEDKLSKYVNLSTNLEDRLALENRFWDVCDLKDYVKNDHNEFINSYYINSNDIIFTSTI